MATIRQSAKSWRGSWPSRDTRRHQRITSQTKLVGVKRPADDERLGDALNQRPGDWVLQAAPRSVKSVGDCERALHIVAPGYDTGDAGGGGTVTRI